MEVVEDGEYRPTSSANPTDLFRGRYNIPCTPSMVHTAIACQRYNIPDNTSLKFKWRRLLLTRLIISASLTIPKTATSRPCHFRAVV